MFKDSLVIKLVLWIIKCNFLGNKVILREFSKKQNFIVLKSGNIVNNQFKWKLYMKVFFILGNNIVCMVYII